jgi:malate synthase
VKSIEELQTQIAGKCDELAVQEQKLEQKRRDVAEQTQMAKSYMLQALDDLRQRIDVKERELLQKCDDMQNDYLQDIDQSCRLVRGRQTNMCNAINDLSLQVRQSDEAQLATFFVTKFDRIKKTCLVDSELSMLKDQRSLQIQPKVDIESLDAFMKSIESVQLSIEGFAVTADQQDRFTKQKGLAVFAEQQQFAKQFQPNSNAARPPQLG